MMQTVEKMGFGVHCTGSRNIAETKRLHIDCRLGNSLFSHFVNRFLDQYDSLWIMHIGVYSEQVAFV